jgi:hypothetical protein
MGLRRLLADERIGVVVIAASSANSKSRPRMENALLVTGTIKSKMSVLPLYAGPGGASGQDTTGSSKQDVSDW